MTTFKPGDRVKMLSGLTPEDGGDPLLLRGVVEKWFGNRLIVRWKDWPAMTALPNPNVEHEDKETGWAYSSLKSRPRR